MDYLTLNNGVQLPMVGFGTWDVRGESGKIAILTALEMYEALKEAYEAGTVRAIGISNFGAKEYDRFLKHCGVIPTVDQVESHVYYPQLELKERLARHGTQMQSWASFTEGRRNIFAEPLSVRLV